MVVKMYIYNLIENNTDNRNDAQKVVLIFVTYYVLKKENLYSTILI